MDNTFKTLKPLTEKQEDKCDKIISLLLELQKEGVHPIVLDGGGGSGLEFIRCSKSELVDIGDELLDTRSEVGDEIRDYIYTPNGTWKVTVDYLVP